MNSSLKFCFIIGLFSNFLGCSLILTNPQKITQEQRWEQFRPELLQSKDTVEIYFNENMVPYINAKNDEDLALAFGYVQAYMRHGQMEIFKMASQGRLSEMGGPFAADIDHTLRILDVSKKVPDIIKALPAETLSWSKNYLKGINTFIKHNNILPVELKALNIRPKEWTLEELVTFWRLAAFDINFGTYIRNLKFQDKKRWKTYWNDFISLNDGKVEGGLGESVITKNSSINFFTQSALNFTKSGSNSFAISGEKTKSGYPIMANDPHVGTILPPLWFLVGLKSPSRNMIGFTIPGFPVVALGRNPHISWGGTNMRGLSSYLYELGPKEIKNLKTRKEKIKVRGWFNRTVEIRDSEFGPIISDSPLIDTDKVIALKWVGHEVTDEVTAFLKAGQSKNFKEFKESFKTYGVSAQNMLMAGRNGDIGHVLAVKKQIRKNNNRDLINSPENTIEKLKGPTELSSLSNPKNGFIVSANNNPKEIEEVGWFFSSPQRYSRLKELLGKEDKLDISIISKLQLDTHSRVSKELFLSMKRFVGNQNKITEISKWDFNFDSSSKAAVLYKIWAVKVAERVFTLRYKDEDLVNSAIGDSFWEEALKILIDKNNLPRISELINESLDEALEKRTEFRNWGEFRVTPVQHVLGNIPILGSRYRHESIPASGTGNTVYKRATKNTAEKAKVFYGQNARHISDLSDLNENYFILFGGNDGWINSPNYRDQIKLWKEKKLIKFPLDIEEISKTFSKKFIVKKDL